MAKKRKAGSGTVRLREDGRWEARVVTGYRENGNPITKCVMAKSKTEVVRKLDALKESLSMTTALPSGPLTFGAYLTNWYQNDSKPKLRPTTQSDYENWLFHHLVPCLGSIPLDQLTQADLQSFFNDMKQNGRLIYVDQHGPELATHSVRSCYSVCKMALDKAVQDHLIQTNPVVGCKLPPPSAQEMQVLTKDEMKRFLVQAKEEGFYELFLIEMSTGLRQGELLGLQWHDLNLRTGTLHIDRQVSPVHGKLYIGPPKTKSGQRTIVLPKPVLGVLAEYKKNIFSQWMFPSRIKPEQPIDASHVRKKLHAILKLAGCKDVRFHDLRHTFATLSLENGMDVKTLSAIIGHVSSATTLNIYAHVTDDMQKKAANTIDRAIAGVKRPKRLAKPFVSGSDGFEPVKRNRRRPGTGCIFQISTCLWEGRYSIFHPDGKRHTRTVYAHSEMECEDLLAELILEMNAEKARLRTEMLKEQDGEQLA